MALDLPPGTYAVSFRKPDQGTMNVELQANQVVYLWSLATLRQGTMATCSNDCPERIQKGRRVVADWPPTTAAAK